MKDCFFFGFFFCGPGFLVFLRRTGWSEMLSRCKKKKKKKVLGHAAKSQFDDFNTRRSSDFFDGELNVTEELFPDTSRQIGHSITRFSLTGNP